MKCRKNSSSRPGFRQIELWRNEWMNFLMDNISEDVFHNVGLNPEDGWSDLKQSWDTLYNLHVMQWKRDCPCEKCVVKKVMEKLDG